MLVAQPDEPGFDSGKGYRLAAVSRQVDAETVGNGRHRRQRRRVGLGPEGPQFPQENIHGHGPDAVEREQSGLEVSRIARRLVEPPQLPSYSSTSFWQSRRIWSDLLKS